MSAPQFIEISFLFGHAAEPRTITINTSAIASFSGDEESTYFVDTRGGELRIAVPYSEMKAHLGVDLSLG